MNPEYDLLAKYFGGPIQKGPTNTDVAKFILLNSQRTQLGPGAVSPNEPSVMGRIFDILSRPNYAVANLAKGFIQNSGNPAEDIWKGLSGVDKTTFSDVLKATGSQNNAGNAVAGLGLDILFDPTTYIGGAGLAKLGKLGKEAPAVETSLAQNILSKGEPVHPESFGLKAAEQGGEVPAAFRTPEPRIPAMDQQPAPRITAAGDPQLDLPGIPKTTVTSKSAALPVEKTVPAEVPGQLGLKLKISPKAKATDIVENVAKGDPEAIGRVMPMPHPKPSPASSRLANDILQDWNPGQATAKINKKNPGTLNAKQQLKLLHKAREVANKKVYRKGRSADKIRTSIDEKTMVGYMAAEKQLEDIGYIPRIGTGENVRLSDVLKDLSARGVPLTDDILRDFGTSIKPGTELAQSVEAVRARQAIQEAPTVKNILDKVTESKTQTEAANILSDGQLMNFDKFLKKFGKASAKAAGVSPAAEKSVGDLIQTAVSSGKTAAQIAVERNSKMLNTIIATGKQNPAAAGVITRALEKDLGKLPKWIQTDNKAVEFLMGRVATWWGQKDLRPFSLNAIGSALATAAARGKALHELLAPFAIEQRHEAFRLAQGLGTATSPEVDQLATQIRRMMDNLVGNASGASVLTRSAVDIKMLNSWLKRYGVDFKFTKGTREDLTGKIQDYSKGTDWTNSWKTAKIDGDPEVFLFKMQEAMEQATREKALYEELGERFGQLVSGGGYKTKIQGHPYLDGYYFPEDIAQQIPRVARDWSIPAWQPGNPLLKQYDRVLSMWKSGVTIYRPAHHIRNMVGDVYLGWMDGVNSARPYQLALKVQRGMKDAYTDLQDVDQLVKAGVLPRTQATPKPGEILFRNQSGVPFTAEQIGAVAHQKGLLEHTRTIEDIIDLGDSGRKSLLDAKPFGGKVQKFARGASELIGHNARLAHFIDKIAKSRGNNLAEIFEQASRRARKWHPTGLDMTPFEKKYLRRVIPFYTWIRKSTPLLMEGLAMNPGKVVGVSKAYDAAQTAAGIDTPGRDNPFPVDAMFPQWMRAQGLGPIGLPDGILGAFSNQQPPGYVMAGVGLSPLSDLMSQIETPGKTLLTSLTPGIQIPMELLKGEKNFTGEPITGSAARPGAFGQYVGEQIPIVSALQGITGITPFGGETRRGERSGGDASVEALVNWLTAAGLRGTGPYTKQAFYEKYQPVKDDRASQKYEFVKGLKG